MAERGAVIGHGVAWMARWSLRFLLIAGAAVVLWWLVGALWVAVMPVVLGLLITTVLWPPVRWMRSKGVKPGLAATVVMLAGLVVLGGFLTLIVTSISSGAAEIAESAGRAIGDMQEWLSGPPFNLADSQLDKLIDQGVEKLQASLGSIANGLLVGVGSVTSGVVTGIVALILAFLFVKDGPRFLPWLVGVTGERAGGHIAAVLERVWVTLGGFIRTQAVVSLIDAIFIGAGLLILGVPLAIPLAALTFLGGFVPIVGAFVAGALAVLVALVSDGVGTALIVLGIVVVVQQVEGNVLQPILQSRSLKLHGAVVLLAVTAGGSLFGIAGAFLAVPVAATAAVVLRYLGERVDARTGSGLDEPGPDGVAGDPEAVPKT